MASIWSSMRNKKADESRSIEQMAALFGLGNDNPGMFRTSYSSTNKSENPDNDFIGMVHSAYKSSGVVFAVCLARSNVFSEMRFQFQSLKNGKGGDLFGTEDLSIFEVPWPNGQTGDLLTRAIQDADIAGNHYVVVEGVGAEKRLRRLRPDWVSILLTKPPAAAVDSDVEGYLYKPGGTNNAKNWVYYPVDGSNGAIAHWAPIPDPEHSYRGMSWMQPVIKEILGDRKSTDHKLKFFENAATPNIAVSFKETVTKEQFDAFMKTMNESKSGVDHAYETLYLGGGADVKVIGADMAQMDFKVTQGMAETRIAAAGRVHPAIVGLSEGLQGSSLNESNFSAAKENFGDSTMRPLWRSLTAAYSVLVPQKSGARLWYDDSDISFLRQDRKKQAELQATQSTTINKYVMNGFTWDSSRDAVLYDDLSLLKHTGLFSVQLLPPGTFKGQDANGKDVEVTPKEAVDATKPPATKPPATKPPATAPAKAATTNTPPVKK